MTKKARNQAVHYVFLDMARIFGILGVVVIHSTALYASRINGESVSLLNYLVRYAVPLFIVTSGYLHTRSNCIRTHCGSMLEILLHRARRLLVPYFSFSILYMFIRILIENSGYFDNLVAVKYDAIGNIFSAIFLVKDNPAGHLYFLPLLYFTTVIFSFLELLLKQIEFILPVSILLSVFAYIFWGDIYSSINPLKGLGFYALGYALHNYHFEEMMRSLSSVLICGMTMMALLFLIAELRSGSIRIVQINRLCLYAYHFFGAFFAIQVAIIVSGIFSRLSIARKCSTFLGRYTFHIYLLHEPYILTVCFMLLIKMAVVDPIINQTIVIVTAIAVPLGISVFLLDRVNLFRKYFLGYSQQP